MLNPKNWILRIIAWITLAFLFLPLILVVVTAFGKDPVITFPIHNFTWKWFGNIWAQPEFVIGFKMSFLTAFWASLLALLIGIPAVYALTRFELHHTSWFQALFLSPTLIPEIVIGFALYQTLVIKLSWPLWPSLLVGHFLLCVPYVIRLVTSEMLLLDPHIEEAAWILGQNRVVTFFSIVLPNIKTGLIAAFMLSFINSFNNIPITLFLNGPALNMLPTAILNYLQNNYDPTVSAISVVLMLFTAILMFIIEKFLGVTTIRGDIKHG
ncbi:ABC transporter permease [Bombilactobacillus bombi]|uniref:ABC transporter permease n=1 Tax=Bombilactobacillus bombi TaxID=1303590 RepID=A0A417ZC65_9LACO|nr:ABC transporter permease [Bombilactobacillus bombi]RHW48239.1 ABC transporter permease [Bombilactobacillus bombi]